MFILQQTVHNEKSNKNVVNNVSIPNTMVAWPCAVSIEAIRYKKISV